MLGIRRFGVGRHWSGAWWACPFSERRLFRRRHRRQPPPGRRAPPEHHRRRGAGAQAERRPRGGAHRAADPGREHRAGARSTGRRALTSFFQGDNRNSPPNSFLSGGQSRSPTTRALVNFGIGSACRGTAPATASAGTTTASTTNNDFANFSPQVGSTLTLNFTQPLLRNFGIDITRQQLQVSRKNREISDVQVQRGGGDDDPVGEERLLGSGLLDQQPRGAAPVARPGAALAQGEPRPRRDRHDGADRHRPGGGRSRPARGSGDCRRGGHRAGPRTRCAR